MHLLAWKCVKINIILYKADVKATVLCKIRRRRSLKCLPGQNPNKEIPNHPRKKPFFSLYIYFRNCYKNRIWLALLIDFKNQINFPVQFALILQKSIDFWRENRDSCVVNLWSYPACCFKIVCRLMDVLKKDSHSFSSCGRGRKNATNFFTVIYTRW